MEAIYVVQQLWRHRLLVLVGAVVAVGVAFLLGPSPAPGRGYAATQILIDTSRSELVTADPDGADSLYWRATLAADLLATSTSRQSIAGELGIPQSKLAVTQLGLSAPYIPASLPRAAMEASNSISEPYSITVSTDNVVPILKVTTSAPDRAQAIKLAEAAVHSAEKEAASTLNDESLGLNAQRASSIESVQIPGAKGRKKMAMLAVVLFAMWATGLIFIPALSGLLRTVLRAQQAP